MDDILKRLTDLFAKFPTVGPKTARRFVFYLTSLSKEKIDELILFLQQLKNNIKICSFCFQPFESTTEEKLCTICSNPSRNKNILCIVEKEADLISIEQAKKYNGLYFILGNILKENENLMRLSQLKERLENRAKFGIVSQYPTSEIIIATNPTPEGKTASILIQRALKELSQSPVLKITHLAIGLPIGGELEYADEETLEKAFEGRK